MNKFLVTGILCLMFILPSFSQNRISAKPDQPIPLDPAVRYGQLKNGFTYYIKQVTGADKKIRMHLIVNAGYEQEAKDQFGLAHVLEHMGTRRTKHIPFVKPYFASEGIAIGQDFNATTSGKETSYFVSMPSGKVSLFNNSLQLFMDIAQGGIILESSEINAERTVVLQELNGNFEPNMMMRAYVTKMVNAKYVSASMFADEIKSVEEFKVSSLIRFCKDWYRPDLEALIIVGDINADEVEKRIKALFGDMKMPEHPKQKEHDYPLSFSGENKLIVLTNEKMKEIELKLFIKHTRQNIKTYSDLRSSLADKLFFGMLNDRFKKSGEKSGDRKKYYANYKPTFSDYGLPFSVLEAGLGKSNSVILKEDFIAIERELFRVKQLGFSELELIKAKEQFLRGDDDASGLSNQVNEYEAHFIEGSAAPGIKVTNKLKKDFIQRISVSEINQKAKDLVAGNNQTVVIMAPDKEKDKLPDEATIGNWREEAKHSRLEPYILLDEDKLLAQPLIGNARLKKILAVNQKAVNQILLKDIGVNRIHLLNGINIILRPVKPVKGEKGLMKIEGIKQGGLDSYPDFDYGQAYFAANLINRSGLGNYEDGDLLNKFFSKRKISVGPSISETEISISGSASKIEDFETVLQAVYLYFTDPRADTAAFKKLIAEQRKHLAQKQKDATPQMVYYRLGSDINIREQLINDEWLSKLNLEKMLNIYKEDFSNAGAFNFVVTGNFDPEIISPLLIKYLGALPAGEAPASGQVYRKAQEYVPKKQSETIYYDTKEDLAQITLRFKGQTTYSIENRLMADVLGTVLEKIIWKRLREREGLSYSPRGSGILSKNNNQGIYNYFINADCAASKVDKAIAAALDELTQLKENGPDSVLLQETKEKVRTNWEKKIKYDYNHWPMDFWNKYLIEQIQNNKDLSEVLNYRQIIDGITVKIIQELAQQCFREDNCMQFLLMPEMYKFTGKNDNSTSSKQNSRQNSGLPFNPPAVF